MSRPDSPILIHGFDAYYRGQVYPLCKTAEDVVPSVENLVWEQIIFMTDQDPVYIFVDYEMLHVLTWVGSHRITDKSGRTLDFRYWNLCEVSNELQQSGVFQQEIPAPNPC